MGMAFARSSDMLDRLLPSPRMVEVDTVDVGAPASRVWELVRHENLARSPLIRALFALRALPERMRGKSGATEIRIDGLRSTREHPGFQVLAEEPGHEVAVGAIGQVWHPEIPFVHVGSADEFHAFAEPDFAKVAWALRVVPRGEVACRVEVEVRVDATDDDAWRKFKRYFVLIGPGSRFIRQTLLASIVRELGTPESKENERPLAGDDLLPDAAAQVTQAITIAAPPERIWPWLLQIGCRRAGFYAVDALDNGGEASARELHPEWLHLDVGQVLPATPEGDDGFEVLRVEAPRALVLGGLFDSDRHRQLPFAGQRPAAYWQITWAFVLEPLGPASTRVLARARAAFASERRLHLATIRPVHRFMQAAMLRHLAQRVEGRLPRDDVHDVRAGLGGGALIIAAFLTPFLRRARSHWGLSRELAERSYPGDELVPLPRTSFTHGVEIEVPAERAWQWVTQIGADRGGFYSYQWLENLLGCEVQNAEIVHPEWEAKVGQSLVLHPAPDAPRLPIVAVERLRHVLAFAGEDPQARAAGKPWSAVTWLFFVEAVGEGSCRVISRYRAACSDDVATRLAYGPTLLEPVSFVMDRRMLLGLKQRAERSEIEPPRRHF
jgi:hypothetical protein